MKKLILLSLITAVSFMCNAMQHKPSALSAPTREEVSVLNKQIETLSNANAILSKVNRELELDFSQKIETANLMIAELEEELEKALDLVKKSVKHEKHKVQSKATEKDLKKELLEKKTTISLIKQIEERNKEIVELKQKVARLEVGEQQATCSLSSMSSVSLKADIENLKKQNQLLFGQYKKWETEAFKLEQERDALKARVQRLEAQLAAKP